MLRVFVLGQVLFALAVLGLIAERARALFFRASTSDRAVKWLGQQLRDGDSARALAWAQHVPASYVAQVLRETLGDDPERDPDLLRMELRHIAGRRLGVLRGCATLASVSGLLGGILAIRQGLGGGGGLLALQAGLAQQVAFAEALESMALGVGTSALCFFALNLFRQAARAALGQTTHITHLLSDLAAERRAGRDPLGER